MSAASVLDRKVLCLNKTWHACNVVTLRRAIKLLCKKDTHGEPHARVIDPTDFQALTWADWSKFRPLDGEVGIRAVDAVYRIPEIILLSKYNKLRINKIHFSRRALYKRDNYMCQYCGAQPGTEELSVDHVLPKSLGGITSWENCVLACVPCNLKKANRTPEMAKMKLLNQPFKPKFNLFSGDIRVKSWQHFLGEMYWAVELKD